MRPGVLIAALVVAACQAGEGSPPTERAGSAGGRPPAAGAKRAGPAMRYGLGRPADARRLAALDTDVDTTGAGLPAGRGTHAEGAAIYAQKCAACHGARGEGIPPNPRLVQPVARSDPFPFDRDPNAPKTVGNYWPFATTLYDYVYHTMPYTAPGSLTADETYAVVAFMLAENGVIEKTAVMDAKALPAVRMPARGRFVLDDRRGGPEFR
jgi:S-disulfanyl-L-cysteine oxidoreductase SoxD